MRQNRREYFRVIFHESVNGRIKCLGEAPMPVEIDNISVTGMRFTSPVNISLDERVECSFDVLDSSFLIEGKVVRKSTKPDWIEYGIGFNIDQETSSHLFKQLNYYQIRQKKGRLMDS